VPQTCTLEAVYSGAERTVHWRELEDEAQWRQGWKKSKTKTIIANIAH